MAREAFVHSQARPCFPRAFGLQLPKPNLLVLQVLQHLSTATEACLPATMVSPQRTETISLDPQKMELKKMMVGSLQSWIKQTSMRAPGMMQFCLKKTWRTQTGYTVLISLIKDPSLITDLNSCLNLLASYNLWCMGVPYVIYLFFSIFILFSLNYLAILKEPNRLILQLNYEKGVFLSLCS